MSDEQILNVVDDVRDWTVNYKDRKNDECHSIKSVYCVREFYKEVAPLKCSWFNHSASELTPSEAHRVLSYGRGRPLHGNIFQIAIHLKSDERAEKYALTAEQFSRVMQVAARASMEALLYAIKGAEWIRYVACAHPDHPRRPLVRIFADRRVSGAKEVNRPALLKLSINGRSSSMRDVVSDAFNAAFYQAL